MGKEFEKEWICVHIIWITLLYQLLLVSTNNVETQHCKSTRLQHKTKIKKTNKKNLLSQRTFFPKHTGGIRPTGWSWQNHALKTCPWFIRSCLHDKSKLGKKVFLTNRKGLTPTLPCLFFPLISVIRPQGGRQLLFLPRTKAPHPHRLSSGHPPSLSPPPLTVCDPHYIQALAES